MTENKNNNKKEVSCKTLGTIFNAANQKNIEINKIIDGVPYNLSYLLNKRERIEWNVWCRIISNIRPYFTPLEFERMGENVVKSGSYVEGLLFALILFSSGKLGRILKNKLFNAAYSMFTCISQKTYFIDKNRVSVNAYLDPQYEQCPEFFYISKGVWSRLGNQIGQKNFKVELTITSNGGNFDVSWKKEGILTKIKKWINWSLNIKKAFLDLTETHEELLSQYNKLLESKKLLHKQTTQLKTAYDITKSIRQSLDIRKTLYAVTNALVTNADFSSVRIKLFKDLEGNNLDVDVSSGVDGTNLNSIRHQIIIDKKIIGELINYPKISADIAEINDLLNYLLPIINVSIHDSLMLRTITDYKENLESKVEDRTFKMKIAQEKLSQTINLLKEAQQSQNRFFINISHEFRTPLTLILGPSKQIMELTRNSKIKEDANLIHRSAKKLNRLANQLLDISSIEAGKMKLRIAKENVVPIICETVSSFQSFAERKRISLRYSYEAEVINIYIDKDKLDKILSNILSNAIKFTPEGGGVDVNVKVIPQGCEKDIETSPTSSNEFVEISVQDTGIGIPKEQMDKIFDRFYQVDNRLSREYEGTGVGLSLSKELVELHKGRILVESEEGKGTVFWIIFPAGKKHLLPEEIDNNIPAIGDEEAREYETGCSADIESFQNIEKTKFDYTSVGEEFPSLLIIEDNAEVRNYIRGILKDSYLISEAPDGKGGLNKAFDLLPDLIISDIMMPNMDGIQLCVALKSDSRTCHIPVILLTAKAGLKDKIDGLETGADDYIVKPFEADELKARIKNLIKQRERIHEYFKKHGLIETSEKMVLPANQKFLQKTLEIINEHIADPGFNIETFAGCLAISRSLLHKKLNSLIGEPPGELIKRIRLNKAAKLIELECGNITEIAFLVGFNDASYFTACFKKQFGVSPSRYFQNLKK